MRYRQLSPLQDYTVGLPFLVNSADAVGQAVLTKLRLLKGEWFLDVTEGLPVFQNIVGRNTNPDPYIKAVILGTPGVTGITAYSRTLNKTTRQSAVTVTITTIYDTSSTTITTAI